MPSEKLKNKFSKLENMPDLSDEEVQAALFAKTINSLVEKRLDELGITKKELARRLGVSDKAVSRGMIFYDSYYKVLQKFKRLLEVLDLEVEITIYEKKKYRRISL